MRNAAIIIIVVLAVAIFPSYAWTEDENQAEEVLQELKPTAEEIVATEEGMFEGTVTRIISADMIEIDGERMHLLGVRSPGRWWWGEPRECFSGEAAKFMEDNLLNQGVSYAYDYRGRLRDRRGFPRVYIFRDKRFFNSELIERGFALAERKRSYRFRDDFAALEAKAKFYQLGFWHTCPRECVKGICRIKSWKISVPSN